MRTKSLDERKLDRAIEIAEQLAAEPVENPAYTDAWKKTASSWRCARGLGEFEKGVKMATDRFRKLFVECSDFSEAKEPFGDGPWRRQATKFKSFLDEVENMNNDSHDAAFGPGHLVPGFKASSVDEIVERMRRAKARLSRVGHREDTKPSLRRIRAMYPPTNDQIMSLFLETSSSEKEAAIGRACDWCSSAFDTLSDRSLANEWAKCAAFVSSIRDAYIRGRLDQEAERNN